MTLNPLIMQAVVNPLQAILNSLVYKGWDGCRISRKDLKAFFCCCCCQEQPNSGLIIEKSESDNPFSSERPTFSTNHFD